MSFLTRALEPTTSSSFHPLFRMLDEFDNYSRTADRAFPNAKMQSFTPKFDVKENSNGYELHGEFPGIDQKDIEIEFIDPHTLQVRGRTERSFTKGTPPAGFVEGPAESGAITEKGETNSHKAKVEDADEDGKPRQTSTAVEVKKDEPGDKFWISERSVGEFSRSFTFPVRVDQDAVKASMDRGILSIIVPRAKKQESRKITIN